MKDQVSGFGCQVSGKRPNSWFAFPYNLKPKTYNLHAGFTLVETLVAVSILSVAIVSPMALTAKSLATAYYARDQITAFHLAQEAIEAIRHGRDNNILVTVFGDSVDLLNGIPATDGSPFIVDTRDDSTALCPLEGCPPLQWDGRLYGYRPACAMPTNDCGAGEGWENTRFTRTVRAEFLPGGEDEVRISVAIEWTTGSFQTRSFTISANLYRWVEEIQ
ncbi:prepilin-type N-terminal cleavage/methylation domain-containing protein [Candidatus Kaiserbacteria bacterium]|nr:prepilin-type N-terminal cleavage/methylation domain-containing protein [Candidatus Kaiserbacteria bacterium]